MKDNYNLSPVITKIITNTYIKQVTYGKTKKNLDLQKQNKSKVSEMLSKQIHK